MIKIAFKNLLFNDIYCVNIYFLTVRKSVFGTEIGDGTGCLILICFSV